MFGIPKNIIGKIGVQAVIKRVPSAKTIGYVNHIDFRILVLLLLFLFLPNNHVYAGEVLAQINKQLAKAPLTQGKFQQEKRLKFLTKPLISNGHFFYHQNQGVIWQTQTPVQSTLIINDAAMLSDQGKQNLPPAFGSVFKALLGGEINTLAQNFIVTAKQQAKSWQLELKPNNAMLQQAISTISISGDTEVREWELQETSGNLTSIQFSEITHPAQLSDEQQADFARFKP